MGNKLFDNSGQNSRMTRIHHILTPFTILSLHLPNSMLILEDKKHFINLPAVFDKCTFTIVSDFSEDRRPFHSSVVPQVGTFARPQAVLIDHTFIKKTEDPSAPPDVVEPVAVRGLQTSPFKHSLCSAFIVYTFWTPDNAVRFLFAYRLLMQARKQANPNFILLQYDFPMLPPIHEVKMTSAYLIFSTFQSPVGSYFIPCIPCGWGRTVLQQLEDFNPQAQQKFTSILDIRTYWFFTNRNLHSNDINIRLDGSTGKFCTVRDNPKLKNLVSNDCVKHALSESYNFTIEPDSALPLQSHGQILSDFPATSGINIMLLNLPQKDYRWAVHGAKMDSFHFAVITDQTEMGLTAVFMPFDLKTWLLTFTVLTLISILLGLFSRHENIVQGYRIYWFWAASAFLEQSNSKPLASVKTQNNMPVIILLWLIMSFFCGVFYKGALYSYVTSKPPPNVPLTLDEVVQDKLAVFTSSKFTMGSHPVYGLKISIEDLLEGRHGHFLEKTKGNS